MATRADVAKLAGVSASTVSYALTGERSIKPETRERILKAVAELNYVPHFAAGALAGKKANALALLFAGRELSISPVALEYVTGAIKAARDRGYHLILWPSDETALLDIQRFSQSGFLGGVLLMEIELDDERVAILEKNEIPLTMIGRTENPGVTPFVDRDFAEVARNSFTYLHELGHEKIALLTHHRSHESSTLSVDERFRREMFLAARTQGIALTEITSENSAASGRQAFIQLREQNSDVTALISLPDLSTIGFLSAAKEFRLNIPKDFSVLAVNTPDSQLGMAWPPLTTIKVPASEMGGAAADILIDKLEEKPEQRTQQLWGGELAIRGTTSIAPRLDS